LAGDAKTSAWGIRSIGMIFANGSSNDENQFCGIGSYTFPTVCACPDG
jgi:hypothetical protein